MDHPIQLLEKVYNKALFPIFLFNSNLDIIYMNDAFLCLFPQFSKICSIADIIGEARASLLLLSLNKNSPIKETHKELYIDDHGNTHNIEIEVCALDNCFVAKFTGSSAEKAEISKSKNPVDALCGCAHNAHSSFSLLKKAIFNSLTKEQLAYLDSHEKNLLNLIKLINNYSILENSDSFMPDHQLIDVCQAITELCKKTTEIIKSKQIKIKANGCKKPIFITTDKLLLQRAILNIFSEIIRSVCTLSQITVTLGCKSKRLNIEIFGSPLCNLSKIISTRHTQFSQDNYTNHVSSVIIKKLGGAIKLVSTENKDDKIVISLPKSVSYTTEIKEPTLPYINMNTDIYEIELGDII